MLVKCWYVAQGSVGEQTGPYTTEQIKEYIRNGHIAYGRKIRHEEHDEFVEAYRYAAGGQFPELAEKKAAVESKLAAEKVDIRRCVNGPLAKHSNELGAMPTASDSKVEVGLRLWTSQHRRTSSLSFHELARRLSKGVAVWIRPCPCLDVSTSRLLSNPECALCK
eukprot:COSAG02_NODE_2718_length_8166_cov_53.761497_3_plen_165_part_00